VLAWSGSAGKHGAGRFNRVASCVSSQADDEGGATAQDIVRRPWPYARQVANASPSPTPNPDAIKFTLDTTLPETFNITSPDAAVGMPFAEAVFAAEGVAAVFGVNDFVTVRRQPGFEWDPIVAAVVAAAAAHL
jgi:hypothetical protein